MAGMLGPLVWRNFDRAVRIRRTLPVGIPFQKADGQNAWSIPSCHAVAHAFGNVFRLPVVDGEFAYIDRTKLVPRRWLREESIDVHSSFIKHSWIRLTVEGEVEFILDVFPEELCSVFPALFMAPHPAYYVPDEQKHRDVFAKVHQDPKVRKDTEFLTAEMRRIAEEQQLL